MITCKGLYIFFAAAALLVCSLAPAEELEFTLTPSSIEPGQRAELSLYLAISTLGIADLVDAEVLPAINDDLLGNAKHLQILDRDFQSRDGKLIWKYDLTSYQLGTLTIPPIAITYGPHSFSTRSVPLQVKSSRVPEDNELRPEFGPFPPPVRWGRGALYFLALGILYVLGLWAQRTLRARTGPHTAPRVAAPPEEPVDQWLRRRLREIREAAALPEQCDPLVDELTLVLRQYLSRRGHAPVLGWTTRELQEHLVDGPAALTVIQVFKKCDVYKFQPKRKQDVGLLLLGCLDESERALCGS